MVRQTTRDRLAHDITNRGITGWILAAAIAVFYLVLYYTEAFTPVAHAIGLDGKWSFYGLVYTIAVVTGGVFVIRRYRHNRYQIVRTSVVMATQIALAFSVPQILKVLHQPEYYFSYLWPLKFDYGTPGYLFHLPIGFVLYSVVGSLIMVPLLALFLGKRWYCSWICGCGGIANTAGEPFRHLTSKSSGAWRFEKVSIHTVLGLCLLLTALLFVSYGIGDHHPALAKFTREFQSLYGFVVVVMLAGIIGVAAYPIGGTRVWCRNFCPMAALLGLTQKLGRYKITVKHNMCISCGLCSKYCEMGIDVRSYAQANTSFTRASCVGCGLCAEVCPRGVLRLENVSRTSPQEQLIQIARA